MFVVLYLSTMLDEAQVGSSQPGLMSPWVWPAFKLQMTDNGFSDLGLSWSQAILIPRYRSQMRVCGNIQMLKH